MNTEILNIIKNALGSKFQGKIYLCGGAVRDYILGREFSDYDFSVFHDLDLFREKLISVATDFGEYDNISNTHTFRINNIRMEYSSGHSLSDNIYEDAAHRDFTINSLYYD
ncbi:MAG: hypothetical protein KBT47_02920, partial [Armatimonadetes bacterium]|nr:hypothetical protein [Candidatus Hippobium faecium]